MTNNEWEELTEHGFSYQWYLHGHGAIHSWNYLIGNSRDGIQIFRNVSYERMHAFFGETRKINRKFKKCEVIV